MLRKSWLTIVVAALLMTFLLTIAAGCGGGTPATEAGETKTEESAGERPETVEAEGALELLELGNGRFVDARLAKKDLGEDRRKTLAAGQKPFAVIVSCSDSRVPPELIFDQGLGDIFVVRVAGNVIDEVGKGSVEYGVEHLGAHLVVVLGHEKCGAVSATVEGGDSTPTGSIGSIISKIRPSSNKAKMTGASGEELIEATVDENVKESIRALETSPILDEAWRKGELTFVRAKYHLETGEVTFTE